MHLFGRKQEYPKKIYTDTIQRKCKLPRLDLNPGPSYREATAWTATSTCHRPKHPDQQWRVIKIQGVCLDMLTYFSAMILFCDGSCLPLLKGCILDHVWGFKKAYKKNDTSYQLSGFFNLLLHTGDQCPWGVCLLWCRAVANEVTNSTKGKLLLKVWFFLNTVNTLQPRKDTIAPPSHTPSNMAFSAFGGN